MTTAPATETASKFWVETLPLDVRLALAVCEAEGMGVDEYSTGCNEPVFYEVKADFLGCPGSLGSVMARVIDAVWAELERYNISHEHISAIKRQIRAEAIAESYDECLNRLMHWVGIETYDEN